MKPRPLLTVMGFLGLAVALGGWALVYAGLTNRFPHGDPGWANLGAMLCGLAFGFLAGWYGLVLAIATWSDRRRGPALFALVGNALSVIGAVVFAIAFFTGTLERLVIGPRPSPPPAETPRRAPASLPQAVEPAPSNDGAVELVQAPLEIFGLAVEDDAIYGTSYDDDDRDAPGHSSCLDGEVWTAPHAGGAPRVLWSNDVCAIAPCHRGARTYWANLPLYRGGGPTPIFSIDDRRRTARLTGDSANGPVALGGEVFWARGADVFAVDAATNRTRTVARGVHAYDAFAGGGVVYATRVVADRRSMEVLRLPDGMTLGRFDGSITAQAADACDVFVATRRTGEFLLEATSLDGSARRRVLSLGSEITGIAPFGRTLFVATRDRVLDVDRATGTSRDFVTTVRPLFVQVHNGRVYWASGSVVWAKPAGVDFVPCGGRDEPRTMTDR